MTEAPAEIRFKGVSFHLSQEQGPARFVLGLRKSGSSLLNQMLKFIAEQNGVNHVDLPGTFFNAGVPLDAWHNDDLSAVIRPGNMYIGFRNCPPAFARDPLFARSRRVFMFRDPRDALVSQYFSDAYSHSLPAGDSAQAQAARRFFIAKRERILATDINDFVLQEARSMDEAFMGYAEVMQSPLTLKLRYEEHVFQKKRLVAKITDHLSLPISAQATETLLAQVDVVPTDEDKHRFIRSVIPGDHRRKLRPETIARLDEILQRSLRLYDYH